MITVTRDDIERITIIDGRPIPDIGMIPTCFGLTNPIDKRCSPCKLIKSCLIYTAEFFNIDDAEGWNQDELKTTILKIWDKKMEEKIKLRIEETNKTAEESEFKDIIQPNAKKGTATYYAEVFWLQIGGTIKECVEYLSKKHKDCSAYKI